MKDFLSSGVRYKNKEKSFFNSFLIFFKSWNFLGKKTSIKLG
jgi:hypothetical protein